MSYDHGPCCICGRPAWADLVLGVIEWREESSTDLGAVCAQCENELHRSRTEVLEAIRSVVAS